VRVKPPPGFIASSSPAVVVILRLGVDPCWRATSKSKLRGCSCEASSASQVWPALLLQRLQMKPRIRRRPPIASGITCSRESFSGIRSSPQIAHVTFDMPLPGAHHAPVCQRYVWKTLSGTQTQVARSLTYSAPAVLGGHASATGCASSLRYSQFFPAVEPSRQNLPQPR